MAGMLWCDERDRLLDVGVARDHATREHGGRHRGGGRGRPVAAAPTLRPHDARVRRARGRGTERARQRRQGARRPGSSRHPSPRRVLGCFVPERALGHGCGHLCRVRAALGRGGSPRVRAGLAGAAVAIAVAVATSRVLLGVHWFTDVLAGLALGWAWSRARARSRSVAACSASVHRWRSRSGPKRSRSLDASEPSALPTARTLETTSLSYTTRTFWASSPLRPGATSNSTA